MKLIFILACAAVGLLGCCRGSSNSFAVVPSGESLLEAASANGQYEATIERYDPEDSIAVVLTPGWQPETKQYQFNGNSWIPLWSPCESPRQGTSGSIN